MSTRFTSRVAVRATVGFLLVAPLAAPAQDRPRVEQEMIPRALVEALIAPQFAMWEAMGFGSAGRVIVGTLPSGLAGRLWVPPGATVLGGIESSSIGSAILHSNLPPDSLRARYRHEQQALGWSMPQRSRDEPRFGFVAAPGSINDPEEALAFCSGGTMLAIGIRPYGGVQRIWAQAMSYGADVCLGRSHDLPEAFRNHPTLINPPGAGDPRRTPPCQEWHTQGGGGQTSLRTSMSIDEVLAHYGRQLADSGWTPTTGALVMSRSWSRRDPTSGMFVEVTLTAETQADAPGCTEVRMNVNARRDD